MACLFLAGLGTTSFLVALLQNRHRQPKIPAILHALNLALLPCFHQAQLQVNPQPEGSVAMGSMLTDNALVKVKGQGYQHWDLMMARGSYWVVFLGSG